MEKPQPPLELENPLADSLQAELVKASEPDSLAVVQERFRAMQDELALASHAVLADAVCFRDIDPQNPQESPDWETLTPSERKKRLRIAMAAWQGKKDAPVGLSLAAQIFVGIAKARASEKVAEEKTLNVQVVMMTAAMPAFEEIIV